MSDLRQWVPDEAIENLTVRRALQNMEDPLRLASDILKETLPLATMSMAHLAVHSPTEAIRFQAARYIMDRTLGDGPKIPEAKPAWDKIFDSVVTEVEHYTKDD
jgi:hypothetical protein